MKQNGESEFPYLWNYSMESDNQWAGIYLLTFLIYQKKLGVYELEQMFE